VLAGLSYATALWLFERLAAYQRSSFFRNPVSVLSATLTL
jgi:hypothetical protein